MSQFVRVLNRNNTTEFRDKFASVEYRFPPGESVMIPTEAAEHIFGYGLDQKGRYRKFLRMGIANMKNGQKLWDNIIIKPAGGVEEVKREAA